MAERFETGHRAPHCGDVLVERFELEAFCGSGGMSRVFRAHDRLLERSVAVKLLHERHAEDPEQVERFRREAFSVAQLSHPNIVTLLDRGEDGGYEFIVFEFVDGENLKEHVRRSGRLPVRRAVEVAIDCADALAFAHEHGLVHRDVKPQNVLLDGEGTVKVTDFGIARSLEVDGGVTQTGTVLGTSEYLSPEQARGQRVTPASDVYSLGIVVWELLAGEVPFAGDTFVAVALRHVSEQPPSLLELRPDVPPRLAAAVERALAKSPGARFGSMAAFRDELRACLAELEAETTQTLVGAATAAPEQAVPEQAAQRPRRRLARPLAVTLLVLVAAAIFGLRGSHGPAPARGGTSAAVGAAGATVSLQGVGDYDPQGNGGEHSDSAPLATDGDSSTFWYTETYKSQQFGGLKQGLGLVLDAGSSVELAQLTVDTPTPGFTARIEVGDSSSGGFTPDSASQTVSGTTTFTLQGKTGRYYVVWLTQLPPGGRAEISEVSGR